MNITKTKNTVTEHSNGQMEEAIKVSGSMENNMERVIIKEAKELKDADSGKKVEELNG